MKKIGYIHRYSTAEKKGILVYGYNMGPYWKSPSPILFEEHQCRTSIKSDILVYFEIDDNNIVSNIEEASIFNFDRELVLSIASVFKTTDWNQCIRFTKIQYQNISELEEWVDNEELTFDSSEDKSTEFYSESCDNDFDFDLSDCLEDYCSDFSIDDEDIVTGKYQKITLPSSIEEEFALFGKQFRTTNSNYKSNSSAKNQSICIDILDPRFWIPKIPKSRKNYYGKDEAEFIDLLEILVYRRRRAYESYLTMMRNTCKDHSWRLDISSQRALHPDMFQDDCVSTHWTYLFNRLTDKEIENIYTRYSLLQPVLPESFCANHIDLLSEEYGFPSVQIAEDFLKSKIKKVKNATEYINCKKLLHTVMNCNAKHLPEEGTPLCSIDKKHLGNLARSLGRKRKEICTNVKNQIFAANPTLQNEDLHSYVDENNVDLILQIGEVYDFIDQWFITETENSPSMVSESLVKIYNTLPQQVYTLFDSYLHTILNTKILSDLENHKFSPDEFDSMLENCSKWIDSSFYEDNKDLITSAFSELSNFFDLWYAFDNGYASEETFLFTLKRLTSEFTVQKLAQFITGSSNDTGYRLFEEMPITAQQFILNRIVDLYDAKELDCGQNVRINEYNGFDNLENFIRWLTELKSGQYGTIDKTSIETAISKAIEPLSEKDIKYLYDKKYLVDSGERIRTGLSDYFDELIKSMEMRD